MSRTRLIGVDLVYEQSLETHAHNNCSGLPTFRMVAIDSAISPAWRLANSNDVRNHEMEAKKAITRQGTYVKLADGKVENGM